MSKPFRRLTMLTASMALQLTAACTPLAGVRSAQVSPGTNVNGVVSLAGAPGSAASGLRGTEFGCDCGEEPLGGDLGIGYGLATDSAHPYELGVGLYALVPFADAFVQLGRTTHPFGIGARSSFAGGRARYQSIYGRYDAPLQPGRRLLWNPAVIHLVSRTSDTETRVLALSNALGLQFRGKDGSVTPALAFVLTRYTTPQAGPALSGLLALGVNFEVDFGTDH